MTAAAGEVDLRPRLRAYTETLTPSLASLARELLLDPRRDADPVPAGTAQQRSVRLVLRADWVAELFGIDDPEVVARAGVAWVLLACHTVLQDHRVDGDVADRSLAGRSDLLGNLLLTDSLALLSGIAGAPAFWDDAHAELNRLAAGYADEASLGRAMADAPPDLDGGWDKLPGTVTDRYATVRILVAALAHHSRHPERRTPVDDALTALAFGVQIRDDLSDWRRDHARGKATYLLLRLAWMRGAALRDCTPDDLADILYLDGGLEALLTESSAHLRGCLDRVAGLPHAGLRAYLDDLIADNDAILRDTERRKREFARG